MRSRLVFLALFALLQAATASGQASLGSLKGYVFDEEGAVISRAEVMVTSDALMVERTTETSYFGAFRLINLPPGFYTVRISKTNYQQYEQRAVYIGAGKVTALLVTLVVGPFEETIVVIGEAPIIDPEATGQAYNIRGEFLRSLLATERNDFHEIMRLIPGTTTGSQFTYDPQYSYYSVHGADVFNENNWVIDGAKLTQCEYSYMSARINLEAVEDVYISVSNSGVVTPLGLGGYVSLVTKSGGNELHGSAAIRYQPTRFNDSNIEGGTARDSDFVQPAFSAGGAIIKDRIWFFAAARRTLIQEGMSRSPETIANLKSLFPDFSPFRIDKDLSEFFVKATFLLDNTNSISFGYQREWGTETFGRPWYTYRSLIDESSGGPLYNLKWDWAVNDNLLIQSQVSRIEKPRTRYGKARSMPSMFIGRTSYIAQGRRYAAYPYLGQDGNMPWEFRVGSLEWQATSNVNYFLDNLCGTHDLQLGYYSRPYSRVTDERIRPTQPFYEEYVLSDPNDITSELILVHRVTELVENQQHLKRIGRNFALYVSDTWKPLPRLSVTAGVRLDLVRQADELRGSRAATFSRLVVSPNIGFSYALSSDFKQFVRGSFSKRHQGVGAYVLPTSGQSIVYPFVEETDLDLDGTLETVYSVPEQYTPPQGYDFSNVNLGYSNDLSVGYSLEFPFRALISCDYTYRQFKDELIWVDTNWLVENGVFVGVHDPTLPFGQRWEVLNNKWNWVDYHGFDVTFSMPLSHNVMVLASYLFERTFLKGTWQPDDPFGYLQPDKFNAFNKGAALDSQGGGKGNNFRANIVYFAPLGIKLAATLYVQGGSLSGVLYETLPWDSPEVNAHGPAWIVQEGRTIYNPLFTNRRIWGVNRQDGQWRSPTVYYLNFRIGREFKIGVYRLEAYLDIFNLSNKAAPLFVDVRGLDVTHGRQYQGKSDLDRVQPARAAQLLFRFKF